MTSSITTCGSSLCAAPLSRSRFGASRIRCVHASSRVVVPKAQQHDVSASNRKDLEIASSVPIMSGLAAFAPLALTAAAHADEAATAVTEATGAGVFGAGEAALLLAPVGVYALFNIYRDRINPKASFLDYVYIMVFLAIAGNLFSILVYKVRFF